MNFRLNFNAILRRDGAAMVLDALPHISDAQISVRRKQNYGTIVEG